LNPELIALWALAGATFFEGLAHPDTTYFLRDLSKGCGLLGGVDPFRSLLLSELLDHRFHSFGIGHGIGDVCPHARPSCPYAVASTSARPPTLAAI